MNTLSIMQFLNCKRPFQHVILLVDPGEEVTFGEQLHFSYTFFIFLFLGKGFNRKVLVKFHQSMCPPTSVVQKITAVCPRSVFLPLFWMPGPVSLL